MNIELVIPFQVKIVRPDESMRHNCPVLTWPKICDLDYAAYAGPWTVVGTASSELYGAHFLVVQLGRIPEYLPKLVCQVISIETSPKVCPVCNGVGWIIGPLPEGMTSADKTKTTWRYECHGCGGTGWVR